MKHPTSINHPTSVLSEGLTLKRNKRKSTQLQDERHLRTPLSSIISLLLFATALSLPPDTVCKAQHRSSGDSKSRQDPDALWVPPSPAPSPEHYQLDTGDQLHVRFFDRYDRDDLNGDYVIGESGELRLPRIGIFTARGKATVDLERDIRGTVESRGEKLGYFSVEVVRCRPFYIVGLVSHPGSYAFIPGLTVVQAVSLAGGLYRNELSGEAIGQKSALADNKSRLAEAIARRARLEAESSTSRRISMPTELTRLEPNRAREILVAESALLDKSREAYSREELGIQNIVALKQGEAQTWESEIGRLRRRIDEQDKICAQLRKLHEDKIINQQRYLEAVMLLDNLERDLQGAIGNLSQARTDLEKAQRELALLSLGNSKRIASEIAEAEFDITRLRRVGSQMSEHLALADNADSERIATYKIMRRDQSDRVDFVQANETTAIRPGDVIEVDARRNALMD